MTRLLAFVLFGLAAFNVGVPWLDRAGTAALAFGFLALAVGGRGFRWPTVPMPAAPPASMRLPVRPDTLAADRLDALADY